MILLHLFFYAFPYRSFVIQLSVTLLQNAKFGLNVCGEGGEYESFTLDCPLFYEALEM